MFFSSFSVCSPAAIDVLCWFRLLNAVLFLLLLVVNRVHAHDAFILWLLYVRAVVDEVLSSGWCCIRVRSHLCVNVM